MDMGMETRSVASSSAVSVISRVSHPDANGYWWSKEFEQRLQYAPYDDE